MAEDVSQPKIHYLSKDEDVWIYIENGMYYLCMSRAGYVSIPLSLSEIDAMFKIIKE